MTITTDASTAAPAARHTAPLSLLRLLRIELRRSPMPLLLPLIAALMWFDSYRPSTAQAPLWVLRTFWTMGQGHTIIDAGPFVAAMAAWIGSRDGRRGTADLITTIARPLWVVRLATWAATAIWAALIYLVCVGTMFTVYAYQGVQGRPPWWWVAVGVSAVLAFGAAGYALGVFFPSRFAAPLAAFGSFLAMMMSSQTGFHDATGWALILPTNSNNNFQPDSGLFYPYLPDLPMARTLLMVGILVAILGLLGLPLSHAGRRARLAVVVVIVAGIAAAGTAVGLAGTARTGPHGVTIAALHDAADDRAIPYTPVCATAGTVPVCVHPAYRRYLPDVTTALTPVLAEITGLAGAPTQVNQIAAVYASGDGGYAPEAAIRDNPATLFLALGSDSSLPGSGAFSTATTTDTDFENLLRLLSVDAFINGDANGGGPAQQVIEAALLADAGVPYTAQANLWGEVGHTPAGTATAAVYSAAQHFAALPASTRNGWLTDHIAALRAGQITLEQLP